MAVAAKITEPCMGEMLHHTKYIKRAFQFVADACCEYTWQLQGGGIQVVGLDPSEISSVQLTLQQLDYYYIADQPGYFTTFATRPLARLLKHAGKTAWIGLKFYPSRVQATLRDEGSERTVYIPTVEPSLPYYFIPASVAVSTTTLESRVAYKLFKDFQLDDGTVCLSTEDRDLLFTGDNLFVRFVLQFVASQPALSQRFSATHLAKLCRTAPAAQFTLGMDSSKPLCLTYDVEPGKVKAFAFLSPLMVQSDEKLPQ